MPLPEAAALVVTPQATAELSITPAPQLVPQPALLDLAQFLLVLVVM